MRRGLNITVLQYKGNQPEKFPYATLLYVPQCTWYAELLCLKKPVDVKSEVDIACPTYVKNPRVRLPVSDAASTKNLTYM